MFNHLLRVHPQALHGHSASSLANTIVYEAQTGSALLVGGLNSLVRNGLIVLALVVYLVYLNWQLSLFVFLSFPAVAWVMRQLSRRLHHFATRGQVATDELAYVVEENTLAARTVRIHGAQAAQGSRFAAASDALRRLAVKSTASSAAMTPITQFLVALPLSAVIAIALWQSQAQGQTVGAFVAFITAMLMLIAPIKHLSDVAGPITRGLTAVERGLKLLDELPQERGGEYRPAEVQGRIELQAVGLAYPGRDGAQPSKAALEHLNLRIEPGQTVALVGPSGAGKTSLLNLLPRFLEPSSGQVLLDGVALAEWDLGHLREQFAWVSQDVVLFNDTVAANVALGSVVDEARVRQALEAAHLWQWVSSLPQGMHTAIGHNANTLSGGQRQRLAIARAVHKRAKLLLLDEATAALDSESERHVQSALESLMGQCTSVVVAHRLSTIQNAHCIVVMDHGRIVETGTHAELLKHAGLYARLHALQFAAA
jgi:ATP-binding cassette, subfamily B, bacterial MsbA